jgi:hypothetical protein
MFVSVTAIATQSKLFKHNRKYNIKGFSLKPKYQEDNDTLHSQCHIAKK